MPPLHNQHVINLQGDGNEQQQAMAINLLAQADALEVDARRYRAQAEQLNPSLRIKTTPPVVVEATQEVTPNATTVDSSKPFIDGITGKAYATVGALKGAVSKREKAQANE